MLGTPCQPVVNSGHWSRTYETRAIDTLIYREMDGLLLLGSTLPDDTLREIATRVPVVVFGLRVAGLEEHCLALDSVHGAALATRHLIELGHRAIVHLRGYRQALLDNDVPHRPELEIFGDFVEQSAYQATMHLLDSRVPFTAVFAANAQMAAGARLALYRRGLRVPDDVSLVGFDDLPASAFTTPPLTTVHQPTYQIGVALATHILNVVQGQASTLPTFSLSLVVRESTRPLR